MHGAGAILAALLATTTPAPAPADRARPPVVAADVDTILRERQRPGATAVLLNVWATWCDACRDEMPDLVRFFRAHRNDGLRLVLVSADDEQNAAEASAFLAGKGVDFPSWLKRGDDMAFINGLEPRWSGALPASFLYDGAGQLRQLWPGEVKYADLERAFADLARSQPKPRPKPNGRTP